MHKLDYLQTRDKIVSMTGADTIIFDKYVIIQKLTNQSNTKTDVQYHRFQFSMTYYVYE